MTREEEAKNLLTKMGYKVIKESLEDVEDEELKSAVEELAEYTGNDIEDAEVDEGTDYTTVTFGSEEYQLYSSYDAAEAAAIDSVISLIDDCGGVLKSGIRFENLGGIEQYLDVEAIEEMIREIEQNRFEDMTEEELEEEYGTTDVEEILDNYMDAHVTDPIQYVKDEWGEETLQEMIDKNQVNFNEKELAEDIIRADGIGNTLASYDGEEIDLGNGYYAYRIN